MVSFSEQSDGGIQLFNDSLTITIYPKFGGKIASFRSGDKEWLWQNQQLPEIPVVTAGAAYDDLFYGGIDELFPNDYPTLINGVALPDHGELWSREWEYSMEKGVHGWSIRMKLGLRAYPCEFEKHIYLEENRMTIESKLTNRSEEDFPFLWVLHPAFRISPAHKLHFPAGRVIVENEIKGRVAKGTPLFIWPGRDIGLDLSQVPEANGGLESYYITDLPEGRFILEDTNAGESLQVDFPLDVFPHMWLFMPLGGWKAHYVAVIEPSSGYPTDLADAVKAGTHSVLKKKSCISATVTYSVRPSQPL
ncbi:aldose epimerase family protein [Ferviditalea candida]|uniref:Galactose mutarotase n=1 Tax=Ferviditalea candida TaxID=3108399 RepID=A0ABU5ZEL9_9BACL|nr:hypothetical protein [Paenibacillaceae bacterium T2]